MKRTRDGHRRENDREALGLRAGRALAAQNGGSVQARLIEHQPKEIAWIDRLARADERRPRDERWTR